MEENNLQEERGFQKLLLSMMNRRWLMTLVVLITFMAIAIGILISIHIGSEVSGEWKELLLLLLGALIGIGTVIITIIQNSSIISIYS